MEMNRPGAWVGNHLPSAEQGRSQDGGWWAPCKLLDLSVLAISTAQLDTCGPGTLPVESSPTHAHWPAHVVLLCCRLDRD